MDRFILTRNVAHFRELLAVETDPERRSTIETLLTEATRQLTKLDTSERAIGRPAGRHMTRNSNRSGQG